MRKAQFIKDLSGFTGTAKLWRIFDDGDKVHYIISSATKVWFEDSRPETYLFPSDASGNVTDWLELPGSEKDTLDHAAAVRRYCGGK